MASASSGDRAILERAVRLFGAVQALRAAINVPVRPHERTEHEPAVAAARRALGALAFAVAWAAGEALPLDEAIAEALGEVVSA